MFEYYAGCKPYDNTTACQVPPYVAPYQTVVTPEPVGAVVPLVIVLALAVVWMRIIRGMPK